MWEVTSRFTRFSDWYGVQSVWTCPAVTQPMFSSKTCYAGCCLVKTVSEPVAMSWYASEILFGSQHQFAVHLRSSSSNKPRPALRPMLFTAARWTSRVCCGMCAHHVPGREQLCGEAAGHRQPGAPFVSPESWPIDLCLQMLHMAAAMRSW